MCGILEPLPKQDDLPPGVTFRCVVCESRIRSDQPHLGTEPRPHQTFEALFVYEKLK